MEKIITVRQWIEKFNSGDFESNNIRTQINAGWCDWFCDDDELSERLKIMGGIIKLITNDYILDNYYICFNNNCPASKNLLYDDMTFEPLNESVRNKKCFGITCEDARNKNLYEIFTARTGFKTEFVTNTIQELAKIVNKLGTEFSINN